MAEIPVEKKTGGGLPWWLLPLLGLLILLPLLWFLSQSCNPVPVANTNTNNNANRAVAAANTNANLAPVNRAAAAPVNAGNANGSTISVDNKGTATGERVTDVNIFGNTADKLSLAGRGATLTKVRVNRVLSDRVFTVTAGSGEMFMMLAENLDSGGGKEKQIKMRAGQTVNLSGEIRRVPDGETKDETQNRDLNQKEYAQMKGQQIYLHVNSVEDAK